MRQSSPVRIATVATLAAGLSIASVAPSFSRPGGGMSMGGAGGMRMGGGFSAGGRIGGGMPMGGGIGARGFAGRGIGTSPRMMSIPHSYAPPRMAAPQMMPRMAAPQMMSPRMLSPHLSQPMLAPQRPFAAPRGAQQPFAAGAGLTPQLPSRNLVAPHGVPPQFPGRSFAGAATGARLATLAAGAAGARVLRNPALVGRPGLPLARATFTGSFARKPWLHHYWQYRHRSFPIFVLGWAGPLFWPYAYNDFIDYTFYPSAYDTFWPYAYDDVYLGIFGPYARAGGSGYAGAGQPTHGVAGAGAATADVCSGEIAGLTDWPIERISATVNPDEPQGVALGELKEATAKALELLRSACPTDLPSTPTGRIEATHARLDAMLGAVRTVRPALDKFYELLNDEQKARFNATSADDPAVQGQSQRDLAQLCSARASGIGGLPLERMERTLAPNEEQRVALKELQDANAEAVKGLQADCPTYRALTAVGRVEAMEQRLEAMLKAVTTVEPALFKLYGLLSDEQKERFNRLSPAQS
ncbi:MAG: Spy/CpxP family protein refolding chaperone [Xanthobacteraceae bacterium]